MTGCRPRPTRPIYKLSLDEEKFILPISVIGTKASNYEHTTYSRNQLIPALVGIMLLQEIGEHDFSNLTLDLMSNAEASRAIKIRQEFGIN